MVKKKVVEVKPVELVPEELTEDNTVNPENVEEKSVIEEVAEGLTVDADPETVPVMEDILNTELKEGVTEAVEETVEEADIEEIPEEPSLKDKLLDFYSLVEPGVFYMEDLIKSTGASYDEVAREWHVLFDKGLVCSPQFIKE